MKLVLTPYRDVIYSILLLKLLMITFDKKKKKTQINIQHSSKTFVCVCVCSTEERKLHKYDDGILILSELSF